MGPFDVAWLAASVRLATPLMFAATGELIAERTGVLNIGLEGMILMGAFFGYLVTYLTGSVVVGLVAGIAAGAALAVLMAVLSINARADQIVIGVGLNLLALGVTTFVFREVFAGKPEAHLDRPQPFAIPLLSDIPVIGRALFDQTVLVYLAFIVVAVAWVVLYRTSWGLAVRAAGEVPAAADTAGVRVTRIRWVGTLVAGALAGLAGGFLSVGQLGFFIEGMSAGRGFLALAAVIFGGWRPIGILAACLVFGAGDALQLRLQAEATVPRQVWLAIGLVAVAWIVATRVGRRVRLRASTGELIAGIVVAGIGGSLFAIDPSWHFPSQLWLTLPYLLALLALAGLVGRVHMPSSLAVPYRRGGEA
jgi:general nucleoside transport system permease protein